MNCQAYVSIEFIENALTFVSMVAVLITVMVYKSGYWSIEQRKSRWNRDHFTTWK